MTANLKASDDEDRNLAAEYALGVLQGEARDAFAGRISEDLRLREAVRQWDEHFVAFANDIPSVQPPAHVEKSLTERLFAQAPSQQSNSIWNRLGFWRGLAIASMAAVLALGAWNVSLSPVRTDASIIALVSGQTNAVKLVAYYDDTQSELRVSRTEGVAASGRSFELWLIANQDAPVSLGVLPVESNGTVKIPANLRSKMKGGTLAISDEPAGGSPTGAPTGAVLATGQLSTV